MSAGKYPEASSPHQLAVAALLWQPKTLNCDQHSLWRGKFPSAQHAARATRAFKSSPDALARTWTWWVEADTYPPGDCRQTTTRSTLKTPADIRPCSAVARGEGLVVATLLWQLKASPLATQGFSTLKNWDRETSPTPHSPPHPLQRLPHKPHKPESGSGCGVGISCCTKWLYN